MCGVRATGSMREDDAEVSSSLMSGDLRPDQVVSLYTNNDDGLRLTDPDQDGVVTVSCHFVSVLTFASPPDFWALTETSVRAKWCSAKVAQAGTL